MNTQNQKSNNPPITSDFIRTQIQADKQEGRFQGRIVTRFPPEPNGYLHIGHAKAALLSFGIAKDNNGTFHLRFDDTNPTKEDLEYVRSIQDDLRWLGLEWDGNLYYSSDYFDQLFEFALELISRGKAYVCDLSQDEIRQYRGTYSKPGENSPYRERSVDENLDLFKRMYSGEFQDGSRVLRAKINMKSGNLNLRDPVLYRILKTPHQRTGDKWSIYPTYDFAHGQSDSIEGITHSICSLEFEDHRPLYDWLLDELNIHHPRQIEFARLNISYTVMSKRKLLELVELGHVEGWDDPRMPTLAGMRRRGFTPESIRLFCQRIGVAKRSNTVEMALLEHCVREDLNKKAHRVMAVLHPLRVIIENYPAGHSESLSAVNNPEDPSMGSRSIPFSREIYVEQDDFEEHPPAKYRRLSPGKEVRLRYGYIIKCVGVKKDSSGKVIEVVCTYDPETRGGKTPHGRKVGGTIHWVSASHSLPMEVRLYSHLFSKEKPDETDNDNEYKNNLNPVSLVTLSQCRMEPSLCDAKPHKPYQFERLGYFCLDPIDSKDYLKVFNRTVSLRDSWNKVTKIQGN